MTSSLYARYRPLLVPLATFALIAFVRSAAAFAPMPASFFPPDSASSPAQVPTLASVPGQGGTATGPSVRELVEFTHLVQPRNGANDILREQISPDGARAFVVTRRANVDSDKNRYEILLLDIRPEKLAVQRQPAATPLLSIEVEQDNAAGLPAVQDARWADEQTLVFLGRFKGARYQVYSLNVLTREVRALTKESLPIVSFAASKDLRRVIYAVQTPNPPLKPGAHGVVVGNQSFWSVKFGQEDISSQARMYQYFVAEVGDHPSQGARTTARPLGEAFPECNGVSPSVSISPSGRWAVVPRYEPERLQSWASRYPMTAELSARFAQSQKSDPQTYFSRALSYVPRRLVAWNLDELREQTIVDAPDDAPSAGGQRHPDRLWQGEGDSVIVAGTHLPLSAAHQTAVSALASHVIEYWPDSGKWRDIAALQQRLSDLRALGDGFVLVDGKMRREFHRRPDGTWREGAGTAPQHAAHPDARAAWTLQVTQALNQPPDVVARGPLGQAVQLTSLNPQFQPRTWGTMRPFSWHDHKGREWKGGLMSAADTDVHKRLPLLIQTYGFDADRFYLDGPNLSDGATSAFAGRAFLREGMLVLAMPIWSSEGSAGPGQLAFNAFNDGVRGAVSTLAAAGRVDPEKVGIIGWSATGERVLNLLTFSDLPIRAATLADGDANTLFSYTITYGSFDTIWGRKEQNNDGMPFGKGLSAWIRNDPALHTDCIQAALRIETYGPWVLNNWDLYALLRRQYKPVEMVVIPGGTHQLGTPGDRMVSLQGNVDWFGFWLAGNRRTTPVMAAETTATLQEQYRRWNQMLSFKAAGEAKLSCSRKGG